MSTNDPADDPVPGRVILDLDEAFRVLEALEDAASLCASEVPLWAFKMNLRR